MSKARNERTSQAQAERDDILAKAARMRSWSELLETVHVPAEIGAALATGRPELLKLMQPRELTADECGRLYHLLGVLIETNQALIAHAQAVADMSDNIQTTLKSVVGMNRRVNTFANFGNGDDEEQD